MLIFEDGSPDRAKAFCKLCNCNLEAKLSDLREHKATNKHSDQKNQSVPCYEFNRPLDVFRHVKNAMH